jgi:hypothetical protein
MGIMQWKRFRSLGSRVDKIPCPVQWDSSSVTFNNCGLYGLELFLAGLCKGISLFSERFAPNSTRNFR